MGEAGVLTRVLAPAFGAFLTYGSLDAAQATAPGQIERDELRHLYRVGEISRQHARHGPRRLARRPLALAAHAQRAPSRRSDSTPSTCPSRSPTCRSSCGGWSTLGRASLTGTCAASASPRRTRGPSSLTSTVSRPSPRASARSTLSSSRRSAGSRLQHGRGRVGRAARRVVRAEGRARGGHRRGRRGARAAVGARGARRARHGLRARRRARPRAGGRVRRDAVAARRRALRRLRPRRQHHAARHARRERGGDARRPRSNCSARARLRPRLQPRADALSARGARGRLSDRRRSHDARRAGRGAVRSLDGPRGRRPACMGDVAEERLRRGRG